MLETKDIAWAAGFLEGEGCFHPARQKITAAQVQLHPLEKLRDLFGGSIKKYGPYGSSKHTNPYYLWALCGSKCAGLSMTIYDCMSPRRKEQIKTMLDRWKISPGPTYNHNVDPQKCPQGHQRWAIIKKTGWRYCMDCNRDHYHQRKARLALAGH